MLCHKVFIFSLILHIKFIKCAVDKNVCLTLRDYANIKNNTNCWYNYAAEDTVPEIIKKTGYPFIEYKVQTKDGYILTLFRIPSLNTKKMPIFMLHGMQCTSGVFVSLGKDSLADAGYDVWLGNYRGTKYSEGHINLNVTQKEYWDYGVDEIALIDVPTMISLVSDYTKSRGKIIYIGHSLGTTVAMIYASEYFQHAKDNIKLFIWLSPAYKLTNMRTPYRYLFPLIKTAIRVSTDLNMVQILSRQQLSNLTQPLCLLSPILMRICLNVVNLFFGLSTGILPETIPVLFNQIPGGTSLKTLTYLSEAVQGRFNKYDYGSRNMILYGRSESPEYNISKIQVPVFIFYSVFDWVSTKQDSLNLYKSLPKSIRYGIYEVTQRNFNHFDFLFGKNAKHIVYDALFKVLKKIESN